MLSMHDERSARWLLIAVFAPTLGLLGCFGSDAGAGPNGAQSDAGPTAVATLLSDLPGCEDGEPDLVDDFTLAREVDYIADRRGMDLLSERGTPCLNASDEALCFGSLDVASAPFRHLVTTEAGQVRIWEDTAAVSLFGGVDSIAEAAWMVGAVDYRVRCDTEVERLFDLYVFDGVEGRFGCIEPQATATVSVSPEGLISELRLVPIEGATCEIDPAFGFEMGFAGSGAAPPPPPPL
jgi:hypothetical protein